MFKKLIKALNFIFYPKLLKNLFLYNTVASFEHKTSISNTMVCKTAIDIGTNKGQFSLMIKELNKNIKIYGFEPLPEPSKVYNKIFKSNPDVKLFNVAIGPISKTTDMHVSKKEDSSSILPIGKRQEKIFKGTGESHLKEVLIAPLDSFIDEDDLIQPVFLKVDVQGFELEVLKGCSKYINKIKYIYVECSFIELYDNQALAHEIIEYLVNFSFNLIGVYNMYYDKKGIAIQADFLFSNDII